MNTIRLYHSTRFANLASILQMGVMTTNNRHSEGHGDMLWFTTTDDYGSEVRISIDVPQEEIENGRFEFVNKVHAVTYDNVDIHRYNFKIDSFAPLYMESFGAYYGGFKGSRLVRLANDKPEGILEDTVFRCFYQEYGDRKDIQVILNYIKNNNKTINERKNMKKTIKINESQLRHVIRESLRKIMLNEMYATTYKAYVPLEYMDVDVENRYSDPEMGKEVFDLLSNEYSITFNGRSHEDKDVNYWGVDEIGVADDDGLETAIQRVSELDPELGKIATEKFNEFVSEVQSDPRSLDWDEYDDSRDDY